MSNSAQKVAQARSESKIEIPVHNKTRRHTHSATELDVCRKGIPKVSSRSSDYVYVNSAYVGSLNSINETRTVIEPPTSVVREQYWTCSKWPITQKVLALAVGVLFGAVLGLVIALVLKGDGGNPTDLFDNLFRSRPAPD